MIGSTVDQEERDRLDEGDDPARLQRPDVATHLARRRDEHPPGEHPAQRAADRQWHPVRDRDPEIRRDRLRDDGDDPRPGRVDRRRWPLGVVVGRGERAVTERHDRGERDDPAHR